MIKAHSETKVEDWRDHVAKPEKKFDKIQLSEDDRTEKLLGEQYEASPRLQRGFCTLRRVAEAWEEKKDEARDLYTNFKELYGQTRVRAVSVRATESSGLRENIEKLFDEVEATDLEFQTMLGLYKKLQNVGTKKLSAKKLLLWMGARLLP